MRIIIKTYLWRSPATHQDTLHVAFLRGWHLGNDVYYVSTHTPLATTSLSMN